MAKVKTYAVEVTITHKIILFTEARRPNGAVSQLQTPEGWRSATRYHDDLDFPFDPNGVTFGTPREM